MAGTLIWRLKPQKPFELRSGGRIRLDSVVDAHGQPIAGARVQIVIEPLETGRADPTPTSADTSR